MSVTASRVEVGTYSPLGGKVSLHAHGDAGGGWLDLVVSVDGAEVQVTLDAVDEEVLALADLIRAVYEEGQP